MQCDDVRPFGLVAAETLAAMYGVPPGWVEAHAPCGSMRARRRGLPYRWWYVPLWWADAVQAHRWQAHVLGLWGEALWAYVAVQVIGPCGVSASVREAAHAFAMRERVPAEALWFAPAENWPRVAADWRV